MRLLTESVVAATTTGTAGAGDGFDPWKVLGIPGAILALFGLATYAIGGIRPLSVKHARYWHAGQTTRFSCIVRNRSFLGDRTITALTLVDAPGWVKRTFWPFWKRRAQHPELIVWGLSELPTLSKRNERTVGGELRKGNVAGVFAPGPRSRLLAHAGSRSSRSKRLEKL